MIAQGTISKPLDGDSENGTNDHCAHQHDQSPAEGLVRDIAGKIVPRESANHKHIAMREIDEAQHSINHRIAERDESIDRTKGNAIDELLEEFVHSPC